MLGASSGKRFEDEIKLGGDIEFACDSIIASIDNTESTSFQLEVFAFGISP